MLVVDSSVWIDFFNDVDHPSVEHLAQLLEAGDLPIVVPDLVLFEVLRGFRQFDAPVCVIVAYDRELSGSDDTPFDCGAATTALVNAAWSKGLGCVINSQGIMQSPVVREHAGIPDDQVIMKAVALGWPDPDFPANRVYTHRKSVDEAARFVGFD